MASLLVDIVALLLIEIVAPVSVEISAPVLASKSLCNVLRQVLTAHAWDGQLDPLYVDSVRWYC